MYYKKHTRFYGFGQYLEKERESEKQEDGETEHNLMTNPCQLYRGWVSGEIFFLSIKHDLR